MGRHPLRLLVLLPLLLLLSVKDVHGFGFNYAEYSNMGAVAISGSGTVTSQISVSGFLSQGAFDSNSILAVSLDLTHSNPETLEVFLTTSSLAAKSTYHSIIIGYSSYGGQVPCPGYYANTVIADGQPHQNPLSGGDSSIPCPPGTLTATGGVTTDCLIFDEFPICYDVHNSVASPFSTLLAGLPINDLWTLKISSSTGSGTLSSWSIFLYCKLPTQHTLALPFICQ